MCRVYDGIGVVDTQKDSWQQYGDYGGDGRADAMQASLKKLISVLHCRNPRRRQTLQHPLPTPLP